MTTKAKKLISLGRAAAAIFLIGIGVLALGATPAFAQSETLSAWWHLSSGSRPANIQPDAGADAVQRLTVSATSGSYVLLADVNNQDREGTFTVGATPEAVKTEIEAMYGSEVQGTGETGPHNRRKESYE